MAVQLYHRWHCGYSARVRDFIEKKQLGDRIEFIELGEVKAAAAKLTELTGETQVPCLVIDGQPLQESAAIVQWLNANLVQGGATESR